MRILVDTNVLVSAFAFGGVCADVFDAVLGRHHLFVARETLVELERVLVDKLAMPAHRAREYVAFVGDHATVVQAFKPAAWPQRDPDDRLIVGAALEHGVDMLLTGDPDILEDPQTELTTVSPRELLDLLTDQ